jgi:excisionase family DNA binding protein
MTKVFAGPHNQLLTPSETASALRVSPRFVRQRIKTGEIPVVRFGRAQRIHEDVVLELQRFGLTGERHYRERPRAEDDC